MNLGFTVRILKLDMAMIAAVGHVPSSIDRSRARSIGLLVAHHLR